MVYIENNVKNISYKVRIEIDFKKIILKKKIYIYMLAFFIEIF